MHGFDGMEDVAEVRVRVRVRAPTLTRTRTRTRTLPLILTLTLTSADKREEAPAVPLAPLPTAHDKRTQTTPRLSLTTSCGTQTSPQPAARSP